MPTLSHEKILKTILTLEFPLSPDGIRWTPDCLLEKLFTSLLKDNFEKYIIRLVAIVTACPDIKSQIKGVQKSKCPVCGANAWHTVVRRDNSKPADRTWVTTLYRVCTSAITKKKCSPPAENNTEKK